MALEPSVPRTLWSCLLAASVWCIPGLSLSHAAVAPAHCTFFGWVSSHEARQQSQRIFSLPDVIPTPWWLAGVRLGAKWPTDWGQGFPGVRTPVGKVGALEPTRSFLCPSHKKGEAD